MRITQVSSGLMATQILTSVAGVALRERRAGAERRVEAEREPTAGGGGADDERAARNFRGFTADDRFHGKPPYVLDVSLAAMCTADRMRW